MPTERLVRCDTCGTDCLVEVADIDAHDVVTCPECMAATPRGRLHERRQRLGTDFRDPFAEHPYAAAFDGTTVALWALFACAILAVPILLLLRWLR